MDAIGTGVRFRNILTYAKRGFSGIISYSQYVRFKEE